MLLTPSRLQQPSRSLPQMPLPPRTPQQLLPGGSCGVLQAAAGSCCCWSSSGLSCRSADHMTSGSYCLLTLSVLDLKLSA